MLFDSLSSDIFIKAPFLYLDPMLLFVCCCHNSAQTLDRKLPFSNI